MSVPPFTNYFVVNAEAQKLLLGGNTESDSYMIATEMLRYQTMQLLETNKKRPVRLEIAEIAAEKMVDRFSKGTIDFVSGNSLGWVRAEAYDDNNKVLDRAAGGFTDDGTAIGQDEQDKQVHREFLAEGRDDAAQRLLTQLFRDLLSLSRRSWVYYHLAGCRCSCAYRWKGFFARAYLTTGNQATVAQDTGRFRTVCNQMEAAITELGHGKLDGCLVQLLTSLQGEIDKAVNAAGHEIEIRKDLIERGLELLVENRPEERGGYASETHDDFRHFAAALENLSKQVVDKKQFDNAAGAASVLIDAITQHQVPADRERLSPWLNELPACHTDNEFDVETVLNNIHTLPMAIADAANQPEEESDEEDLKREADRSNHETFVNGVTAALRGVEPDFRMFECLNRCLSRNDSLSELANSQEASPQSILATDSNGQDEVREILEDWQEKGSEHPAESIFSAVNPDTATLERCRELLVQWNIPGECPGSWNEVDQELRDPILVAVALRCIARIQTSVGATSTAKKQTQQD
jgi:hypothetical protein